ncbi:GPI alpha-1,4-mannosyltransferase I, stabilizing subunit-like [Glandiceps talaboti]
MGIDALLLACIALVCSPVCGDSIQVNMPEELAGRLQSVDREVSSEDVTKTYCLDNKVTIHRSAKNKGFHRDVITDIEVNLKSAPDTVFCEILQWQTLPSSIYIDTYQMKSRHQHNNTKVLIFEDIDTEKPSYLSPSHTIAVYSKLYNKGDDVLSSQTVLPIHLRYQQPSEIDDVQYTATTLPLPFLLLHCKGDVNQDSNTTDCGALYETRCSVTDHKRCQWQLLTYNTEDGPLTFQVPIGNQQDTLVVTVVTMATTLFGCLVLVVSMLMSPKSTTKLPHQD